MLVALIEGVNTLTVFGEKHRGRMKGQCLGVYSCSRSLLRLDRRSREYRLIRQVRQDLVEHVGGKPNAAQRMLIERAAILSLRVAMLDQKIVDGAILTTMDNHQYLAWANALRRTIAALGLEPAPPPQRTLEGIRAEIIARRAQPEAAA